ncbi:hypothetical protein EVAR_94564_1 [Eumeta japonica]|uniref:Uncharacterized protein n=1 Tax=Eumeta variegata TaxID=151549 RepID=A0A4C1UWU1_EUMVA|nr:hypothetical protein EVAR_94564_1 [Eumeta japonica]
MVPSPQFGSSSRYVSTSSLCLMFCESDVHQLICLNMGRPAKRAVHTSHHYSSLSLEKKERKRHLSLRKQLKGKQYGRGRRCWDARTLGARGKGSRFWDTRKESRFLDCEGRGRVLKEKR